MAEKKETIKFKYKFDKNYNPVYVNGAFGGVSSQNELIINFFTERHGLPLEQIHELNNGKLGKEIERKPDDQKISLIRFVDTGIIMSERTARVINAWLTDKIKEFDNAKEKKD